jgi:hypothetical protein
MGLGIWYRVYFQHRALYLPVIFCRRLDAVVRAMNPDELFTDWFGLQKVILTRSVPITNTLIEDVFIERLDEMDNALVVARAATLLAIAEK